MPPSDGNRDLGREIKRALSAAGLSVAGAARKMEVDPKRLYRWINGEVNPPLSEVERLAQVIGQPIVVQLGPQTERTPSSITENGAMSAFIERWESGPAPRWARDLTDQVLSAVSALHSEAEALREIRESLGAAARGAARAPQTRPPGEEAPPTQGSTEPTREASPPLRRRAGEQGQ
jgi:transcriptional regulator with XRE-family HTH domain